MQDETTNLSIDTSTDQGSLNTGGLTVEDRSWLENAIVSAGGKVTDTGFGCGGGDIGYEVNGNTFSVHVSVRQVSQQQAA